MSRGKHYLKFNDIQELLEHLEEEQPDTIPHVEMFLYILDDNQSLMLDVMTNYLKKYDYLQHMKSGKKIFQENYYEAIVIPAYQQLEIKLIQWWVRYRKWEEEWNEPDDGGNPYITRILIKSARNYAETLRSQIHNIHIAEVGFEENDDGDLIEVDPFTDVENFENIPLDNALRVIDIDYFLDGLTEKDKNIIYYKFGFTKKSLEELGITYNYYKKRYCIIMKKLQGKINR